PRSLGSWIPLNLNGMLALRRSGLCQCHRVLHINPCLSQHLRDCILFQPRSVELHSDCPLLLVELYTSDAIHLAHAVNRAQLALSRQSLVIENQIQISHLPNLFGMMMLDSTASPAR